MVLASAIGLVIFILVVIFAFSFFSDYFEDVFAFIGGIIDQTSLQSENREGNVVCDMTFELFGAFDEAPFGLELETQQRLYLGMASPNSGGDVFHPEVARFQFRDCHIQGQATLFNLFPTFYAEKIGNIQSQQLALTNLSDLSFQINLKFIRLDDRTVAKSKILVVNEQAFSPLPKRFSEIFPVDNIEATNYDVEITCSGDCSKINNLPAGQPFIYNIRP